MADFVAVLKKTIDGLPDNNPQARQKIYDRARTTIEAKLQALDPQPPQPVADRQRDILENAITQVEAHYAPPPVEDEESDDGSFDDIFAAMEVAPAPEPHHEIDTPEPSGVVPPLSDPETPQEPQADAYRQWTPDEIDERPDHSDEVRAEGSPLADPDSPVEEDDREQNAAPEPGRYYRRRSRGIGRWLVAAVVLIALAGAGYAAWMNRTDLMAMVSGGEDVASQPVEAPEPAANETPPAEQTAAAAPEPAPVVQPDAPASTKFTQRLTEDGTEVDMGPAGAPAAIGEGTSVAAASQAAASEPAPPQSSSTASEQTVAVGQQAMFYEERTTSVAGSVDRGSTVWSVVQESPGGEQPPEAAIRAEVSIPDRDLQLRLTIRRNADQSLPASHIIEMIFLTPDDFAGGGIDNVLRVTMKPSEEDTGNALLGIPAKIADGFFLLALSDRPAEQEANTAMLRRQGWIDIPIVYRSGRRALMTLEKGLPGEKAFNDAMDAWQSASSG